MKEVVLAVLVWLVRHADDVEGRPAGHHLEHEHAQGPPVHAEACNGHARPPSSLSIYNCITECRQTGSVVSYTNIFPARTACFDKKTVSISKTKTYRIRVRVGSPARCSWACRKKWTSRPLGRYSPDTGCSLLRKRHVDTNDCLTSPPTYIPCTSRSPSA